MKKLTIAQENFTQDILIKQDGDFGAEEQAMLQAFYSRSTKSIDDRLSDLGDNSEKIKENLSKYYLGYGHRSIGQCAAVPVFFENVSILAAKAIQNNPLYNGQETSSRYLDFTTRPFIDPLGDTGFDSFIRQFYSSVLKATTEALINNDNKRATADMGDPTPLPALKARAFDIARGFLTAGFTTKLSWFGSFDNLQEHLTRLAHAPNDEISILARTTLEGLSQAYPNSIRVPEIDLALKAEINDVGLFFDKPNSWGVDYERDDSWINLTPPSELDYPTFVSDPAFFYSLVALDPSILADFTDAKANLPVKLWLKNRRKNIQLPRQFGMYGTYVYDFQIDYGSYRDIQRHRNGLCSFPSYEPSPFHTDQMHSWYYNALKDLGVLEKPSACEHKLFGVSDRAKDPTIGETLSFIYNHALPAVFDLLRSKGFQGDAFESAYMHYVPMATLVRTQIRYDLPQALYVSEMRSAKTVHPTARIPALHMLKSINNHYEINLFGDETPDQGVVAKRANQTIMIEGKALDQES